MQCLDPARNSVRKKEKRKNGDSSILTPVSERPGRPGSCQSHSGGKVLTSHARLVLLLSQSWAGQAGMADGSNPPITALHCDTAAQGLPDPSLTGYCLPSSSLGAAFLPDLRGASAADLKSLQKAPSSHRTSFFPATARMVELLTFLYPGCHTWLNFPPTMIQLRRV